jgi:hypothetical protein
MYDVLQILHAPRQAIDARDDKRIAFTQELEKRLQLGPSLQACC